LAASHVCDVSRYDVTLVKMKGELPKKEEAFSAKSYKCMRASRTGNDA
jgi:hypothetical protein